MKKLLIVLVLLLCVPAAMLLAQGAGQQAAPAKKAPAAEAKKAAPAAQKKAAPAPAQQEEKTVTTPSGLKYVDLKEGTGPQPKVGQTVVVTYVGRFENGKIFDQNNKSFEFVLGKGEVIKGWDEGVSTMKVGGHRKLTVPPNLAYGQGGYPGVIPPNSTLVFDVTLLRIK